jgi:hypothetical protein
MVQITVNDELAREIADAGAQATLVDIRGRALGRITPIREPECPNGMSSERWMEIQRRMREPGAYFSYGEIKKRLGW